uniref:Collagen, type XIV, alpha 1b n=1 Tax=Hippocampus comes TaxID=109280 RepID=A0A3Q3DA43_HIPCM
PAVERLDLSDPTHDTMRVRWSAAPAASGYMILYAPLSQGEPDDEKEVKVASDVEEAVLEDLTPSTEYTVTVYALYGEEASDPVTGQLSTALLPATNLRLTDVGHNSARLSWDSASGKATGYSVIYARSDGVESNQVEAGRETSWLLSNLSPLTEYTVGVVATYDQGRAQPATQSFSTPLPPRNLRVSEEWYNRFRISWDLPGSPTTGFRVVYQPLSGPALETFVGKDVSTMMIVGLLSGAEYGVKVLASYGGGSSEPLSGRARTPLAVTELSVHRRGPSGMCAQWRPQRHAGAYRVVIESPGGHVEEAKLSAGSSRHCFANLRPGTAHKVSVYARLQDGTEGPAVSATDDTVPPAKEVCKAAKADLAFLVDGSWSIGDDNFLKIIGFLSSTAGALDQIGPDGTQVAIAQFSDDTRTEFALDAYDDKERLLDAINKISYKGGNTKTRAIRHMKDNIFTAEGGVRRGVPKVLVVLTDGRSQDDVNKISKEMRMEFIIFAIGFADADYGELVSIASEPSDRHVFFVDDLDAFKKIEEKLVTFVCEAATAS